MCYKQPVRHSHIWKKYPVLLLPLLWMAGCATQLQPRATGNFRHYELTKPTVWRINPSPAPRFDASALLLQPNGDLLTVNDRSSNVYRIDLSATNGIATLEFLPEYFTDAQLKPFAGEKSGRYDSEGLAQDEQGRIYLCEEANRWVMRYDPASKKVERLPIDWTSVERYFKYGDVNASFEGIAVGGGNIYVANEREQGRIIVVDAKTFKITDSFVVPKESGVMTDPHYSDLCWFAGELYVLMREKHVVLRIDPKSRAVLAEYRFERVEESRNNEYRRDLWFTGVMEGLAVDKDWIWLVTDNNGLPRRQASGDTRPTLFRFARPDK